MKAIQIKASHLERIYLGFDYRFECNGYELLEKDDKYETINFVMIDSKTELMYKVSIVRKEYNEDEYIYGSGIFGDYLEMYLPVEKKKYNEIKYIPVSKNKITEIEEI